LEPIQERRHTCGAGRGPSRYDGVRCVIIGATIGAWGGMIMELVHTPADALGAPADRLEAIRAKLFELIKARSFGRGRIVLASGRVSDFYFDMKPTMLRPEGASWLAELALEALDGLAVDYIGGLEMGAVPLAAAMAQLSFMKGRPIAAFFVRKQAKEHGAQKLVEGLGRTESLEGRNVVIIEDVTTTGESALRAVEVVKRQGANIVMVLSVVDRQEGAAENFRQAGIRFRSLFTASQFVTD
jgi:orotate phosphoribosyltransferase